MIIRSNTSDARRLTELTLRSKNVWGYGNTQIELWREELTITNDFIASNEVFNLLQNNEIVGFYAYTVDKPDTIKLEFLFVEPNYIGKGFGKTLFNDFIERIQGLHAKRIVLDADPNAKEFYEKLGFKTIGTIKSSIEGRYLPVMELILA